MGKALERGLWGAVAKGDKLPSKGFAVRSVLGLWWVESGGMRRTPNALRIKSYVGRRGMPGGSLFF